MWKLYKIQNVVSINIASLSPRQASWFGYCWCLLSGYNGEYSICHMGHVAHKA